jgi:hypothetical protein
LFPPVAREVEKNHVKRLDVKEVRRRGRRMDERARRGGEFWEKGWKTRVGYGIG